MKILYLTTSIEETNYDYFLGKSFPVGNPSNQNFHSKMIRALALAGAEVTVLSLVPFSTQGKKIVDHGNYHYIEHPDHLLDKVFLEKSLFLRAKELGPYDSVIFDSLNRHLGKVALRFHSTSEIVALLTDKQKNLTNAKKGYVKEILGNVSKADASIALSEGLLETFSMVNKPHWVTEGIIEERGDAPIDFLDGSYLYFGGALLPRYGIYDLIKAYEKTKPDYDLVIAGHGASLEPFNNPRIKFVGQVSKQTNYALQAHAAALINPRPYDLHLDAESVPSKMLEYLASGKPVISTLHSKLKELFPEEVNWVDGTLLDFFTTHLDENRKLVGLKENHSQQKLEELYGLKTQGQRIYSFLQDLSSLSKESITLENSK